MLGILDYQTRANEFILLDQSAAAASFAGPLWFFFLPLEWPVRAQTIFDLLN